VKVPNNSTKALKFLIKTNDKPRPLGREGGQQHNLRQSIGFYFFSVMGILIKMNKWVLIAIGVAAVIAIIAIYELIIKPSQVQAVQVPTPTVQVPTPSTTSSPPQPGNPLVFPVQPGSYLAQFSGQKLLVASTPPITQTDDSVWVAFVTPANTTVLVPIDLVAAQRLGIGPLITSGVYVTVQTTAASSVANVSQQSTSSTYASYGKTTVTLKAGVVRDIVRGNKTLFNSLYSFLQAGNQSAVASLIQQYSGNQNMSAILSVLGKPGALISPLSITYSAAIALGIVPPQIQSYVGTGTNVIVDFGYV